MNRGKEWLVRAGFALAALAVGPPIVNFENTQRVTGALFGEDVSCGEGIELNNPQYRFDAIVVPGAGRLQTADGTFEPTEYGKLRLEAAAILYVHDFAPMVILLNGVGKSEEDTFTEVRYLQDKVQELTGNDTGIPDEAILMDDTSINTATNMSELARIAVEYGLQNVVIDTNEFQSDRAVLFACVYGESVGLSVSSLPAERVVASKYPERADELAGWNDTEQMKVIQAKETAEVALIVWDPKGYVPTWLRSFLDF